MENWKIRVLKSDRNECRYHAHSGLLTVLYKNREGFTCGFGRVSQETIAGGVKWKNFI